MIFDALTYSILAVAIVLTYAICRLAMTKTKS